MLRSNKVALATALLLVAFAAVAPVSAQLTVLKGVDLFVSQSGTMVDFSDNPLPTNFFGCGEKFAGTIALSGKPILADKQIGNADTIIQRLNDIPLVGGSGSGSIRVAALCLKNNTWTDPCGHSWKVSVRLDQAATQPAGTINITQTSATGGTFGSSMTVLGEVSWSDGFTTLGPVADSVNLTSTGGCWSTSPGTGGLTVSNPLTVDSNCDGTLDKTLPGTSNFHPGWCPGTGTTPPTWTPIPHSGPHPVGAGKKCRIYKINAVPIEVVEPVEIGHTGASKAQAIDVVQVTGYTCGDATAQ
jgi:hypothetical protein